MFGSMINVVIYVGLLVTTDNVITDNVITDNVIAHV